MSKKTIILITLLQIFICSCHEKEQTESGVLIEQTLYASNDKFCCLILKDSITIKYGTSFGQCIGYCKSEYHIHKWGIEKINNNPISGGKKTKCTTRKQILPIEKKDYQDLLILLNFEKFENLDDKIGCPDCDDSGAEWIEIQIGQKQKKVTFEYGSEIKSISEFLNKIRTLIK